MYKRQASSLISISKNSDGIIILPSSDIFSSNTLSIMFNISGDPVLQSIDQKSEVARDNGTCEFDEVEIVLGEIFSKSDNGSYEGKVEDSSQNEAYLFQEFVVGRLKKNLEFWKAITNSEFVLETIEHGYRLPLKEVPPLKTACKNNKSARNARGFVEEEIAELLETGCISEINADDIHVLNPLSVSTNKKGKQRLILDCHWLNDFLHKKKFKCEDLKVAKEMLDMDDYMYTFDLKKGYHHIEILEEHQKFLCFAWTFEDGVRRYFRFKVLPFGVSTGPHTFTKILKPLVTKWRGEGKKVVIFLDDGLGGKAGSANTKQEASEVRYDLFLAGFMENTPKSDWEPGKKKVWLGMVLDLIEGKFYGTEERIRSLKEALMEVVNGYNSEGKIFVKTLASVTGKLISLHLAIGNLVRIMTRSMFHVINKRRHWFDKVSLTDEAMEEVNFWIENIDDVNGLKFKPDFKWGRLVYSDASGVGYGGFTVAGHAGKPLISKGNWDVIEQGKSSTWRELEAVNRILAGLGQNMVGHMVRWRTDNQNVARIVHIGSTKGELQTIALNILRECRRQMIDLVMEWIPREENTTADDLSKDVDYDDWMLDPLLFGKLDMKRGPHTIDRFANEYNTQLKRFVALSWVPKCEAVDAFKMSWLNENNWIVVPPRLLPKVINQITGERAQGTVVVPMWKSAVFWPLLCPDGVHLRTEVSDWCELPRYDGMFIGGKLESPKSLFGGKATSFRMIAVRFERNRSRVFLCLKDFCLQDGCHKCSPMS